MVASSSAGPWPPSRPQAGIAPLTPYITTEALRVATLSAWQLDNGDDAAADVLVPRPTGPARVGSGSPWPPSTSTAGSAPQHRLPVHRRFLWATQLANSLGTVSSHLADEFGALMASGAPA